MENGDFDPQQIQNRLRAATKSAVGGLAGVLLGFLAPGGSIIALLSLPFAIVGGWQAVWYGATLLNIRLEGAKRRYFQIAIALLTPAIASLWFFKGVGQFTITGFLADATSWWVLLLVAFLGLVCWEVGGMLHKQHPFRGFLAVTAVIFIVMFLGHAGMSSDPDCDDERDLCRLSR
jgi:hypothetical protein